MQTRRPRSPATAEVVKVDVDLVTVDALVLQKNTARIVGGLKKEDFSALRRWKETGDHAFQSG